ncbi:hypothetical protein Emag_000475 [Eimeria magna]
MSGRPYALVGSKDSRASQSTETQGASTTGRAATGRHSVYLINICLWVKPKKSNFSIRAAAMPSCACLYHKRLGADRGPQPAAAAAAAAGGAADEQQQQQQQQQHQQQGGCGYCENVYDEGAAACSCRKGAEAIKRGRWCSWIWGAPRRCCIFVRRGPPGAPWAIPKELLLVFYMMSAMLTSCVYFGFPSIRRMLLQSGAYEWLCGDEPDTSTAAAASAAAAAAAAAEEAAEEDRIHAKCRAQDAAVAPLFTVALVSHSMMSAVAGMLLDHAGPKLTALVGQGLNILGWLLLGLSNKSLPFYIPAFICIGSGADTSYLPLLKIVSLFHRRGVVIALLGVACTSSFALPVVLEKIWLSNADWRFSHVCGVYLLLGPGVGLAVALFFIPWRPFSSSNIHNHKQRRCLSLCESNSGSSIPLSLTTLATDAAADPQPLSETPAAAAAKAKAAAAGGGVGGGHTQTSPTNSACIDVPEASHLVQKDCSKCSSSSSSRSKGSSSKSSSSKTTIITTSSGGSSSSKGEQKQKQQQQQQHTARHSFLSEFLSIRFLCILLLAAAQQLAISFYHMSAHRLLEPQVSRHLDIFLSLACIPCVFFGIAIDLFGILRVLALSNFLGFCAYAVTLGAPAYTLHMASLVSFCGYVALDSELVFCCVSIMFSSSNFGRLAGLAQATGGLLSLISIPLYNSVSMRWFNGDCKPVALGLTVMLACIFPLLGLLYWLQRRLAAAAAAAAAAAVGEQQLEANKASASIGIQLTATTAAVDGRGSDPRTRPPSPRQHAQPIAAAPV